MNAHNARRMAIDLMAQHKLTGWTFRFDRARKRFGCCNYRTRTISLSAPMVQLNDEDRVREVTLHEIAHALVGPGHGHDWTWKRKAAEVGAKPVRCYTEADTAIVHGKFQGVCPGCNKVVHRFKTPKRPIACAACCKRHNYGRFTERFMFTWAQGGRPIAQPAMPRAAVAQLRQNFGSNILNLFGLNEEAL